MPAVPLVPDSNPLTSLSLPDLAAVLAGRITNWHELGAMEAPVVLHALMPGSGLLRATEARLGVMTAPSAFRHETAEDLAGAVAAAPWAIAISSMAEVGNARALDLTGKCRLPLRATAETVISGDYPLALLLALYAPELYAPDRSLPPVLRDLLAWVASPDAAASVRGTGFVDQQPGRIALAAKGGHPAHAIAAAAPEIGLKTLQAMVAAMADADRVTPTFRCRADGKPGCRLGWGAAAIGAGSGGRVAGWRAPDPGRLFRWLWSGNRQSSPGAPNGRKGALYRRPAWLTCHAAE